jgi:hypothetical protein
MSVLRHSYRGIGAFGCFFEHFDKNINLQALNSADGLASPDEQKRDMCIA